MLMGKLSIIPSAVGVVMSSPKMNPAIMNAPTLPPPVKETTAYVPVEQIPEIVVTAKRIPWYAWVAVGVAGFGVLNALTSRK